MEYRLAGASYRAIAEKLTEDRAQAYADEHGVSFERAIKKFPHVSKRTVWDDVTAEMEDLQADGYDASVPSGTTDRPWRGGERKPRGCPVGRDRWVGHCRASWPATNAAPGAAQRLGRDFPQKPVIPGSFARPNTSPTYQVQAQPSLFKSSHDPKKTRIAFIVQALQRLDSTV